MFSIFKKASNEQEVVLQDLTEEQLTQAAGGRDHDWKRSDRDWDDHKKWMKHHHHHHHHHMNDHDWDDRKSWSHEISREMTYGGMHW